MVTVPSVPSVPSLPTLPSTQPKLASYTTLLMWLPLGFNFLEKCFFLVRFGCLSHLTLPYTSQRAIAHVQTSRNPRQYCVQRELCFIMIEVRNAVDFRTPVGWRIAKSVPLTGAGAFTHFYLTVVPDSLPPETVNFSTGQGATRSPSLMISMQPGQVIIL